MNEALWLLVALLAAGGGVAAGYVFRKKQAAARLQSVEILSQKIVDDARREAETLKKEALIQAKDQLYQLKLEFEHEGKERRAELAQVEKRLSQKEELLDKRAEALETRENELSRRETSVGDKEKHLEKKRAEIDQMASQQKEMLERIAGLTQDEAKAQLEESVVSEARHEAAKTIRRIESETRESAAKKSQEILALACKRYAGDYAVEKTVSVVNLPSEEMKGRIIGREGRNIRAIEAACGIDLIIDDTPEAVIISGFNPMRREIARLSLERLISDGRIHPARIEEIVKKVSTEVEASIKEAGEQATFDVGVHGIHPELVKLLGRLRYRSSYSQNVLQHSIEVAFLSGIMAAELGINPKQARRAGLLHDIGKAVDHEIEGPHALIGQDLAKRFNEKPHIVHAIAAHHEDLPPETVLDVIVQAADALSGARPGARREMLESYVKRLEELEAIANAHHGVANSYAIQAGREVRIVLEPEKTSDEDAVMISRDVARKIEEELMYPGQIKVTVIRETRAVDFAK
ncbi:metal dependent phosphohydrolase [Desulfarculus baarsii DSM 2075]|uniref:Ribonuclease Y n=1 Tax=Desulfarculus baarsii (strain ATCC 33931 / DSM 2075 / LMG 7858 / VKM B-1802 / 2st14) TaxID=644282 RepID=E1QGF9_DESB2|nr:ribonuclease Y [Desulfarculus baarsii]ADK83671.1 metal dependent phosphohydrolase [Desulfarculus baarsii DSM 2075]